MAQITLNFTNTDHWNWITFFVEHFPKFWYSSFTVAHLVEVVHHILTAVSSVSVILAFIWMR